MIEERENVFDSDIKNVGSKLHNNSAHCSDKLLLKGSSRAEIDRSRVWFKI